MIVIMAIMVCRVIALATMRTRILKVACAIHDAMIPDV